MYISHYSRVNLMCKYEKFILTAVIVIQKVFQKVFISFLHNFHISENLI